MVGASSEEEAAMYVFGLTAMRAAAVPAEKGGQALAQEGDMGAAALH